MLIEMPTLEACPRCKRSMLSEKAYYSIHDELLCLGCAQVDNARFLRVAEAKAIAPYASKWKRRDCATHD